MNGPDNDHYNCIEYRGVRLEVYSAGDQRVFMGWGFDFRFPECYDMGYMLAQVVMEMDRRMGRRYQ